MNFTIGYYLGIYKLFTARMDFPLRVHSVLKQKWMHTSSYG